jgi:phosphogluconate dehydratase
MITVNGESGELILHVSDEILAKRALAQFNVNGHHQGMGRELFSFMRKNLSTAETGACSLFSDAE